MQIEWLPIKLIRPYPNNPRHNAGAVDYVAESIKEFGFKNPILIDENNQIINGHTRHKAAKKLKLKEVPVIRADDLTEAQIKAYRLADNKSSELAEWDVDLLNAELSSIESAFDLKFEMPNMFAELAPETSPEPLESSELNISIEENEAPEWAAATQEKVENILNLGIAEFEGVGAFDIPQILAVYDVPEVDEWVGFNYAMSEEAPENKGLHFFVDDYQFERVWNNPNKYIEILQRFKCVLSPDFSPYGDMPFILQAYNHYRKHWCARFWQANGITVLPTIRASTDPRSKAFYLLGEPERSVVAFSSMWASQSYEATKQEFELMVETLQPSHILLYGNEFDFIINSQIPFTRVPTFAESRFKNG